MPIMFAPLRLKTPITRNEMLLMRNLFADGRHVCKQVSPHGIADHAHLVLQLRISRSVNISPLTGSANRGPPGTTAWCR